MGLEAVMPQEMMSRVRREIASPWWKPADKELSDMLWNEETAYSRKLLRFGAWVGVLMYCVHLIGDIFLLPDVATNLVIVRVGLSVVTLVFIEIAEYRNASLQTMHMIAAVATAVLSIMWLVFAIPTRYQANLSHFMVYGTTFVWGANLFFNWRFWLSAATSFVISAVYIVANLTVLDVAPMLRLAVAVFFVSSFVFSLYLSYRLSREHYHRFLHGLNAKFQEQLARATNRKLETINNTDPATGLKNRRAITREFRDIASHGLSPSEQVGVILVRAGGLESIRTAIGEKSADEVLVKLSKAVVEIANGHKAVIGRYADDDLIVMAKVTSEEHLKIIARQLCESVENFGISRLYDGEDGFVKVKIGATMTRNGATMDLAVLIRQADRAVYSALSRDNCCFCVFDESAEQVTMGGEPLAELLGMAIGKNLVSVEYQPIVDAKNGSVTGHEALMRLNDLNGRQVCSNLFIPVAEQTGAINELGMWLLERVFGDMVNFELGGTVSVNVSPVQLKDGHFAEHVVELASSFGINPRNVAFEIAETNGIAFETQIQKSLGTLRSAGFKIWLDDFGAGYTGIGLLRDFRFDMIKIDQAMLNDCLTESGKQMLANIVRLVVGMGIPVLMEGVETEEQRGIVESMGIDFEQGFLFARPMPTSRLGKAA